MHNKADGLLIRQTGLIEWRVIVCNMVVNRRLAIIIMTSLWSASDVQCIEDVVKNHGKNLDG